MNILHVTHNLREAANQLQLIAKDIQARPDYSLEEMQVALEHAYGLINTAWNARDASAHELQTATNKVFASWVDFPTDLQPVSIQPSAEHR